MQGMRILVVDDHSALRETMTEALAGQQDVAAVDAASNGAEALRLLGERSYDVMVTDIVMPVMDGYTLMQEMRRMALSPAPKPSKNPVPLSPASLRRYSESRVMATGMVMTERTVDRLTSRAPKGASVL